MQLDNNEFNTVSLFDGVSSGQVALKSIIDIRRYNIKVNFAASEISPHPIKATQHNFPDTIQLGDVRKVTKETIPFDRVDLLLGGSPCQGFSNSGKMLNFDDPRSKLFFEYVRILKEVKPRYFLLENVVMKKEWQDIISEHLGVQPVKLNSALTSAQNRVRLYWANFPIREPEDKGIQLWGVLEDHSYYRPAAIRGRQLKEYSQKTVQCLEVRGKNPSKSNCLTTVAKDTVLTPLPVGRYPDAFNRNLPYRNYTKVERCRLMNLPDKYLDCLSDNQALKATGNGWEVGMIEHIFRCMFDSDLRFN